MMQEADRGRIDRRVAGKTGAEESSQASAFLTIRCMVQTRKLTHKLGACV